jgi:hypothetical protein
MNEIKINKPKISSPLSEETKNIIKDRVVKYIKATIGDYNNLVLYDLLDDTYISEGDSNYDIVASFIIKQMIANNYELYYDGEEILLTNSNSNLVTREDIENYLEENTTLKKYLEKITWEYYFDEINIDNIYSKCIKYVRDYIEGWGEGEFDKYDFEKMTDKTLDNQDHLQPDDIFNYNPEFQDYLQVKFLKADKLSEIQINKPGQFIKLNLPKDLDRLVDTIDYGNIEDSVKELIVLNPQIPSNIIYQEGAIDDVHHESEYPISSLKDIIKIYFRFVPVYLFYYYNGYNQEETEEQYKEMDRFAKEAMNGKWTIIPQITDFKNDKPYDEDLNEIKVNKPAVGVYFLTPTVKYYIKNPDIWENDTDADDLYDYLKYNESEDIADAFIIVIELTKDNKTISKTDIANYIKENELDSTVEDYIEFLKDYGAIMNNNNLDENQLLREYPESTVSKILTKWEMDPNPQSQDSKVKAARALITRFEQIKSSIPQKLDILVIPDEIKRKDPRNIELYSLEDMIKLIKSYPENPDKVKKDAIENFATKYQIDKATAQSYVARFMTKKDNLKYAVENGTEDGNFTKEEVLELIPKRLLQNNLYLDPRNWQWQPFEQALDSLFPSQKQVTGEEGDNEATTDADKVYDKDGIEIYQGDDVHKCISYNPVDTQTKRKKYGWCVTQIGNTNYDYYRFAESSPTFYFVFDRSKESTPEHSPFKDQWHAFVIQVNTDGESYVITSADNRGDTRAASWEAIPEIVPADTWAKIKNLKQYFKPIALSAVERGRKFVSGKNLSLDEFKELNQDEKILYIQGKASKNTLSNDILSILSQYKISLEGRSTTLANVAIDSGQTFPYSILKDNEALAKRYAIFRFRHTNYGSTPIPLPYVKYLDEPGQKKYYEEFGKGGSEESFLTFELIEKYFGKEVTKQYVNSQLKYLGFLPPEAVNYIDNPKLKILFKAVSKLYEPWKYGKYTNISDEELADAKSQPPQDVTPIPIDVKQWAKLTSEERKILIELTEKYNKNPDYLELMYASPFIIKDKGQTLILLPEPSSDGTYDKWVLINDQDKVIKRNISGDSTLGGDPIASGYTNGATDDLKRVYDMSDLEIEESDSKSLDEIKVNKPNDPVNSLTRLLDNIPNEKYFPELEDYEGEERYDDSDMVDALYYPIFDDYIKGKPGVEGDNFDKWAKIEREKNDGETGPLERLLIDKILDIIKDYRNQQEELGEIQIKKPAIGKIWIGRELKSALRDKGMDLNDILIYYKNDYILLNIDTYKKYKEEEISNYLKSLKFQPTSILEQTVPSVHGGDYYTWMVKCINPNPEKSEINDGNDLWELMKPEFELDIKELLDEIQINKPGRGKLEVEVNINTRSGNIYFTFNLNGDNFLISTSYFSKDYVSVNLDEEDIYSDRLHEDVINYLNKNRIPFAISNEDNDSIIDGDKFEIPEDPEDMFNRDILINKKDCLVPKKHQENFNNLNEIQINKPKIGSTKDQILDKGEYKINGNTYEVLEFDPWGGGWGGTHPPTKNHVWLQKKGTKASDIHRGNYVDYRKILDTLNEIQVNKPNTLKSLVTSYTKYLESISRAEMFDESGNYNSTLKNYHNKLKYYAENGTKEEQTSANFILGLI